VIPITDHSAKTRFCHLRTDYFDHIALAVAHRIDQGRPSPSGASPGTGGLLVGPLGDGVGDPPPAQQVPAGGVAVAPVGDQVGGALAGRPDLPGRGTRMVSSSGSSWVLSWRWPAVMSIPSGRPWPSQARWTLVVSPPRLRPSA
jgi:hypothetical protein